MSIKVNDFRYIPGENEKEYIKFLEESNRRWKQICDLANKRIMELAKMDIISHLEIMGKDPRAAIVCTFNAEKATPEKVNWLCDYIQDRFPGEIVVMIPDYTSLCMMSKDVLENWCSMVSEVIDEI